ncbi:MAG: peptidylprolyl isomerase [Pseudomonadota bacterium]
MTSVLCPAAMAVRVSVVVFFLALPSLALSADGAIVAKVNGRAITEADMRLAEAEIASDLAQHPAAMRRRLIIEFLIQNELFAEAAVQQKVNSSAIFKTPTHYWDRRNLRDAFFNEKIRNQVSDAETRAYYDAQIKNFSGREEVRASHILVRTEDKAKAIFEQIAHDGDFAELARQNSQDSNSSTKGGDLGYFGRGHLAPAMEKAAFETPVGEIALPVRSQLGWHVIKVVDKRKRQAPTFDAVKDRIRNRIMHDRARTMADLLREKAQIEYLDPTLRQ